MSVDPALARLARAKTGDCYDQIPDVRLKRERPPGGHVTIHPYTRHDWKNCADVVGRATYGQPVHLVGLPGEVEPRAGWMQLTDFDDMCESVLGCSLFVLV